MSDKTELLVFVLGKLFSFPLQISFQRWQKKKVFPFRFLSSLVPFNNSYHNSLTPNRTSTEFLRAVSLSTAVSCIWAIEFFCLAKGKGCDTHSSECTHFEYHRKGSVIICAVTSRNLPQSFTSLAICLGCQC